MCQQYDFPKYWRRAGFAPVFKKISYSPFPQPRLAGLANVPIRKLEGILMDPPQIFTPTISYPLPNKVFFWRGVASLIRAML